jgi:Methyltransferase domain
VISWGWQARPTRDRLAGKRARYFGNCVWQQNGQGIRESPFDATELSLLSPSAIVRAVRQGSRHDLLRTALLQRAKLAYLNTIARTIPRSLFYIDGAFERLEKQGLHITDAHHFEDPIPNVASLKLKYPDTDETSYPGIDFNPELQLQYLTTIVTKYSQEFLSFPLRTNEFDVYSRLNDSFPQLDALVYWSFLRSHKPSRVYEIGSGNSSILAYLAIKSNKCGELTVIDPYPRDFTQVFAGKASEVRLERRPVEDIDPLLFDDLVQDDILFIDGSHVLKIGNDVDYMFNRILPRLKPGVLVHIHDIYLPFQYPSAYFIHEHRFWNEQPALALYLSDNSKVQVQFGSAFVLRRFSDDIVKILPDPEARLGASFWYRRI